MGAVDVRNWLRPIQRFPLRRSAIDRRRSPMPARNCTNWRATSGNLAQRFLDLLQRDLAFSSDLSLMKFLSISRAMRRDRARRHEIPRRFRPTEVDAQVHRSCPSSPLPYVNGGTGRGRRRCSLHDSNNARRNAQEPAAPAPVRPPMIAHDLRSSHAPRSGRPLADDWCCFPTTGIVPQVHVGHHQD